MRLHYRVSRFVAFTSLVALVAFYTLYLFYSATQIDSIATISSKEPTCHKCAYASFLCTRPSNTSTSDPYFDATRLLSYQILHYPRTKTQRKIPFLVLVPPFIPEYQREILRSEGATIIPVEELHPQMEWVRPGASRYQDQFTKLRISELTQYERILYIDNDMYLARPLDGIFDESVTKKEWASLRVAEEELPKHLPTSYNIVACPDTYGQAHTIPPEKRDNFNAGFFMLRPSNALFRYYRRLLNLPFSFDSTLMEQALLNHAHRPDGNMPWKTFKSGYWNVNWPTERDFDAGVASLHDKFWEYGTAQNPTVDKEMSTLWFARWGNMTAYWAEKKHGHVG